MGEMLADPVVGTSVHALIAAVTEETDADDPSEIADLVLERIPDSELRDAFRPVLRSYVVSRLASFRSKVRAVAQEPPASARWDGASSVYLQFLRNRVAVSGQWRKMGECTAEDADWLASERMNLAKATATEARRFQMLAKAVRTKNVKTIGDLDEPTLLEIIRWQP